MIKDVIQKVNNKIDGELIVFTLGGSRLYGTYNSKSDYDFKGVFIPSIESILTGRIVNAIRIKDEYNGIEVDSEIFSLHKFIKLCCEGQTVAFDMLHTPDTYTYYSTDIWRELISNKNKFYSKNIKSFIGYAKNQASKYLIKIEKYNELLYVYNYLSSLVRKESTYSLQMKHCWSSINRGTYIQDAEINPQGIKQINICGKIYPETAKISYVVDSIKETINKYGMRVEQGVISENTDWKSFYHAYRVASEIKELFEYNTITLPCYNAGFLKKIREGMYDIETLTELLDNRIKLIDILKERSSFPEKVDYAYWDNWLINIIYNYIMESNFVKCILK